MFGGKRRRTAKKHHSKKHAKKHHSKKTAKRHHGKSAQKSRKKGLSSYQKFMKAELHKMKNVKLAMPQKFKKIAALWKKK